METREQRLLKVAAVVSDVDGVLTDGAIVTGGGGEIKTFHVRDGLGIKLLQQSGIPFALLSGRASEPVHDRAKELDIRIVKTGRIDKQQALLEIAAALQIQPNQMAYIGDDLPDLAPMQMAAVSFCPQDACEEVKVIADWVLPQAGGKGAVRAMIEHILQAQGKWRSLVAHFEVKHD